jgi:1-aminocyclopropane-1-carboxylate deaminase
MGGNPIMGGYGYSTTEKDTWARALEEVRAKGGKPYAIPAGASDHPLGGLGYANADEVAMQEQQLGIFFDNIVVATCTGSTQAGMVGFAAQEKRRRVIGIDTADDEAMTRRAVTKIANDTSELIASGVASAWWCATPTSRSSPTTAARPMACRASRPSPPSAPRPRWKPC